jgi:hypothetical protein
MTLNMWKRDMAADARILTARILTGDVTHFTSDLRHFATDTIRDAKAEVAHLADPAQHEWIIERHVGFFVFAIVMFTAGYFGVIAYILSLPAAH